MDVIDLSFALAEGMPHHPMHPRAPLVTSGTLSHEMTRRWMGEHPELGPVSFVNEHIVLSGHTGTHVDAPLHGQAGADDAAAVELDACVGPATILHVSHLRAARGVLTRTDLEPALPDGRAPEAIVLLHTGWVSELEIDPARYYRHSMGIDGEAAAWLRALGVRCVGIDAPSIDTPHTPGAPAHMEFLRRRPPIYIIENLCNLDRLGDHVDFFAAAPLPLAGSSGSPVRAYAIPVTPELNSAASPHRL